MHVILSSLSSLFLLTCFVFRVGGEKVLLLSAAAWGAMTAFTPILAHFCSQPIVSMTISRFLMGLLQGGYYQRNRTITQDDQRLYTFMPCCVVN